MAAACDVENLRRRFGISSGSAFARSDFWKNSENRKIKEKRKMENTRLKIFTVMPCVCSYFC
jgi:hypothetical protein